VRAGERGGGLGTPWSAGQHVAWGSRLAGSRSGSGQQASGRPCPAVKLPFIKLPNHPAPSRRAASPQTRCPSGPWRSPCASWATTARSTRCRAT
jgi:hypothetical protein